MAKVAFLGLGVMGFPMAGHLVKKGGHDVTVFNRTPAKAKAWAEKFGGKTAATPKAAVATISQPPPHRPRPATHSPDRYRVMITLRSHELTERLNLASQHSR